jgi:hypothetical protein
LLPPLIVAFSLGQRPQDYRSFTRGNFTPEPAPEVAEAVAAEVAAEGNTVPEVATPEASAARIEKSNTQ